MSHAVRSRARLEVITASSVALRERDERAPKIVEATGITVKITKGDLDAKVVASNKCVVVCHAKRWSRPHARGILAA